MYNCYEKSGISLLTGLTQNISQTFFPSPKGRRYAVSVRGASRREAMPKALRVLLPLGEASANVPSPKGRG